MKRNILMFAAAIVATTVLFSCSKPDDNPNNGGENNPGGDNTEKVVPDVSVRLLSGTTTEFSLTHAEDGTVSGEVSFQVYLALTQAASEQVSVTLQGACEGISADKVQFSPQPATIAVGKTESDPVTVTVSDWSDLSSVAEAGTYTLRVSLASATGANATTYGVTVNISKAAQEIPKSEVNVTISQANPGGLEAYTLNQATGQWAFDFWCTGGATPENKDANTFAGTGSGDLATDNDCINFIVDFGSVTGIGGIWISHWGDGFRARSCRLSMSDDKENWTALGGELTVPAATYYVVFEGGVQARYLRYEMLTATSRVDLKTFYAYLKAAE